MIYLRSEILHAIRDAPCYSKPKNNRHRILDMLLSLQVLGFLLVVVVVCDDN